jgi:hypothetical protein
MSEDVIQNGILIERYDDATRTATYYDEKTGEFKYTRPYNPDENATADAAVTKAAGQAGVDKIITDLKAEKDRVQPAIDATNATINSNPAGYIKDNARAIKRIADACIDLAKFVDPK